MQNYPIYRGQQIGVSVLMMKGMNLAVRITDG